MIGPVSSASHSFSSIPELVLAESLGLFAVYLGIFGQSRPQGASSKAERIATGATFVLTGALFFSTAVKQLHGREVGDATALVTLMLVGTALSIIQFVSWKKFRNWQSWPTSEATVEDANVREVRTRHNHYFVAELGYSYVVNGQFFSGYFTRDFAREPDAWSYANQRRGTKAAVHYHPRRADRSKLAISECDF